MNGQLSLFEAPRPKIEPKPEPERPAAAFMGFVGDPSRLAWKTIKVYQRVKFGQKWMISMARRGPLCAVVTSPIGAAAPEDLDGEAWFLADLYEPDGALVRKNVLVPNASVLMSSAGYHESIARGRLMPEPPDVLCSDAGAEPVEGSSSPVAAQPSPPTAITPPKGQDLAVVRLPRPEPSQGRPPANSRRWTELVAWPDLVAQRGQHLADWQRDPEVGSAFELAALPDATRRVIAITCARAMRTVDGQMGIDPGAERFYCLCEVFVDGPSAAWPVTIDGQQTALSVRLPGRVDVVLLPCALLSEPANVEVL